MDNMSEKTIKTMIEFIIAMIIAAVIVATCQICTASDQTCLKQRIEEHHMGCIRGVALVRNDLTYDQVNQVCKQIRLIREVGTGLKTTKQWSDKQ
jgi:hypothetical protein